MTALPTSHEQEMGAGWGEEGGSPGDRSHRKEYAVWAVAWGQMVLACET